MKYININDIETRKQLYVVEEQLSNDLSLLDRVEEKVLGYIKGYLNPTHNMDLEFVTKEANRNSVMVDLVLDGMFYYLSKRMDINDSDTLELEWSKFNKVLNDLAVGNMAIGLPNKDDNDPAEHRKGRFYSNCKQTTQW